MPNIFAKSVMFMVAFYPLVAIADEPFPGRDEKCYVLVTVPPICRFERVPVCGVPRDGEKLWSRNDIRAGLIASGDLKCASSEAK
jgi:hypothetical protein